MLLWRAALGAYVWRAAFGHVVSAYWHYMIGDLFGVVKGVFFHEYVVGCRRGDSRLRGNDDRGLMNDCKTETGCWGGIISGWAERACRYRGR